MRKKKAELIPTISLEHGEREVVGVYKPLEPRQKLIERLEEENKKLKETIKDHQLYEEKLEHRIIEFEELLHGE